MTTWLTAQEAADHLSMSLSTFKNYVAKGFFPYHVHKQAGTRRYTVEDLDSVFERKRTETGPENLSPDPQRFPEREHS